MIEETKKKNQEKINTLSRRVTELEAEHPEPVEKDQRDVEVQTEDVIIMDTEELTTVS